MLLRRGGDPIAVEPQVFDLLCYFLTNRGRVISKEEFLDEVWGDRFVGESALTTRIKTLRRAVGDDGTRQQVIRTVFGRGYEMIADVVVDAAPSPSPNLRSRIPVSVQTVIGRDDLLHRLTADLRGNRLLTLVGPGGVGKTTVGFELARIAESSYPDGVWVIELVGVVDDESALESIATALDVNVQRQSSIEDAIIGLLQPLRSLLLIDNCEHLIEPIAPLISRILKSAPGVSIVATSREALALPGEHVWPIEPLSVAPKARRSGTEETTPPAVTLFIERAREADPGVEFSDDETLIVAEICSRLDGIPLAIELAAAQARTTDLAEILSRIDQRFTLLKATRRGVDPKHRTLSDAIGWSYNLLDPAERQVFSAVAILAGQFELTAAEELCRGLGIPDLDVLDMLTKLTEQSMIFVRRVPVIGVRYELLETLREYGRNRLDDGERVSLSAAHADHFTRMSEEVEAALGRESEGAAVASADAAFADLRVAQRFSGRIGDFEPAFRLIGATREYAMRTMRYEVFAWADLMAATATRAAHPVPPLITAMRGYWLWVRGEFDEAIRVVGEAGSAVPEDKISGIAAELVARVRANVLYVVGREAEGAAEAERQLEIAEESGSPSRIVHASYMGSVSASSMGDDERGRTLAAESMRAAEETGSPTDLASAMVADGYLWPQDHTRALESFDNASQLASSVGNRWMDAFARTEASGIMVVEGHTEEGCRGLADVVDLWYRAGEWSEQWHTLARCIIALDEIGRSELAARVIGAVEAHSILGGPPMMPTVRERMIAARESVLTRLGDDRSAELRSEGEAMPVAKMVHEVGAALSGRDRIG